MLRDILARLNPNAIFSPLDSSVLDYLEARQVPTWLQSEIGQISAESELTIGHHIIFPPMNSLLEMNDPEPWNAFSNSGFFSLAYGLSGDQIAVELGNKRMVYINHDDLWEFFEESGVVDKLDVRTRMAASGMLFDDFWLTVSLDIDFPCDYYEAVERWGPYTV